MQSIIYFEEKDLLFNNLTNLEEFSIDGVEIMSCSAIQTILNMKRLKSVCVSTFFTGLFLLQKLGQFKPGWSHLSLKSKGIFCPTKLLPLTNLASLDLSESKISVSKFIDLITANLNHFSFLKFINLQNNNCDGQFEFPDSLANSGIKLQFDYECVPFTMYNWKNYATVSTGILIDFLLHPGGIRELLLELEHKKQFSLGHVTHITAWHCSSNYHFDLLLKLLFYLPNLKHLSLEINSMDNFVLNTGQTAFKSVEYLIIDFICTINVEEITNSILKLFGNVKKIVIYYASFFHILKLTSIASLTKVEKLIFNTKFDFYDAGEFFDLISSLPKLRFLDVWFGCRDRKNAFYSKVYNLNCIRKLKQLQLKRLRFTYFHNIPMADELGILFLKFPHLTELCFDAVNEDFEAVVSKFSFMGKLRKLQFESHLTGSPSKLISI